MNVWVQPDGTTVGRRFETLLKPGKKYRIRLINTAMHTHFKFSVDGHDLTVIANDFVPLVPFTTPVVPIGMGQRYDVILTADQPRDNYWMRAVPQIFCSNNTNGDNIKGIVRYAGAPLTDPVSSKWDYGDDVQCEDFVMSKLVPHLPLDADLNKNSKLVNSPAAVDAVGDPSLYLWTLGGSAFNVSWQDPTLRQTAKPGKVNWAARQGVVEVDKPYELVVFIIQTYIQAPHPIHLHGMAPLTATRKMMLTMCRTRLLRPRSGPGNL
jgi:FtsP/CotA-like multicopper oxidase with cupredoxin domain